MEVHTLLAYLDDGWFLSARRNRTGFNDWTDYELGNFDARAHTDWEMAS
jgi:hypothetical protein